VESVPAGCDGVIFHPYLFPGGECGPFVKPTARASFTGLNLNHTAKHLLRAVYEGVAFATLDCYRNMPIEPKIVFLSGGGGEQRGVVSDSGGLPRQAGEASPEQTRLRRPRNTQGASCCTSLTSGMIFDGAERRICFWLRLRRAVKKICCHRGCGCAT
jgi:hypothetical protein